MTPIRTAIVFLSALSLTSYEVSAGTLTHSDYFLLYQHSAGLRPAKALNEGLSSRTDAIAFLRELNKPFTFGNHTLYPGVKGILLSNLGDRTVLEETYRIYLSQNEWSRARSFADSLIRISHPEFMVVVARNLEKSGTKLYLSGEYQAFEEPYGSAFTILRIAADSGFFASEVASWASALGAKYQRARPDLYLYEVRAFWALNHERIEAGEYHLVRPPGAPALTVVIEPPPPKAPEPERTSAPKPEPQKPTPVAHVNEPGLANRLWLWALGGGALVLALFLMLRSKR